MADGRTFTLIGEFKDGITPALEGINRTIDSFKRNMASMSSKRGGGYNDVTQSVGKLVSAQIHLKEAIEGVGAAARSATQDLKEYKNVMGKVSSAHYHVQKSGTGAGKAQNEFWKKANNELVDYRKNLESLERRTRIPSSRSLGAGLRRSGGTGVPAGSGGGGGYVGGGRHDFGGGGGGGYGGGSAAVSAFGQTLGYSLSNIITGAVTKGFEIGVSLMTKPFEYFASAFGERVQDQLDDLKAAGGLYSISKRSTVPFLKTIDDAIDFQQETNATFAKMAGQLPGVTNDYVQVGKRLSDTMARVVFKQENIAGAIERANKIRETEEGRRFYGGKITGTGPEAAKEAYMTLLGDMTKMTTLAGMGGSARGGARGSYGLPALTERMIADDQVSMGQMQRYAAVFGDPMISDALERNIAKINATSKNSLERIDAMSAMWKEILTPELVDKLRTSVDGIYQGIKSSIFDPDSGLFGLGREFIKFGKRMNSFGQYIDKEGKAVDDITKAADANLSLFEILANIFSNTGQVLAPIIESIRDIWDPMKRISKLLMDARHYTGEFARTFNNYREGLKILAKQKDKKAIMDTLDLRAALAAINNLFLQFKVIGQKDFMNVAKTLEDASADPTKLIKPMLDQFLNSKIARQIGTFLGTLIGTVLSEVANVVDFFANKLSGNELTSGFIEGFEAAKGTDAIKRIFLGIYKLIGKALMFVWEKTPLEAKILGLAILALPALVAGLTVAVGGLLERVFLKAISSINKCRVPNIPGACGVGGGPGGNRRGGPGAVVTSSPRRPGNVAASSRPTGLVSGPSNVRMRPVGPTPPKGFENIALPGSAPPVYGVTQPGRAPAIPKPRAPLTKPSFGKLSQLKGKGVGLIASGMIALSTQAPALAKAGKSLTSIGKNIPLLGLAFAGLDFGLRKAEGQDTATAAGGAAGSAVGGVAGAALGSMVPVPVVGTVVGGVLGSMIGGWIGENIAPFFANLPAKLSASWESLKKWVTDLPVTLGYAIGSAIANLQMSWSRLSKWWTSLGPKFDQWVNSMIKGAQSFLQKAAAWMSNGSNWMALGTAIINGIKSGVMAVVNAPGNFINWATRGFQQGLQAGYRETQAGYTSTATQTRQQNAAGMFNWNAAPRPPGNPAPRYKGGLGDAISSELKHKPPGSDLVIANSSETVIPAAGGNGEGMVAFVETLRAGFEAVVGTYRQTSQQAQTHLTSQMSALGVTFKDAQEKQRAETAKITQTLVSNQQQTNARFAALEKKMNTPSIPGGLGGAAAGGVDAFTPIAARMGLQLTSGYRPGDDGWHGVNRARDYSNSTGPTPQMMQFAQYMAATYGSNLKELIYTPLGFSIKNGQRVAPLAAGAHYNHVHVAYAMGLGNPILAPTQRIAEQIDARALGRANIQTYTAGKGEFGGGSNITINAPITINGVEKDSEQIAYEVANHLHKAMTDLQAASILV